MIRVMGLDLKPAGSGIAINYDPVTGEPAPQVQVVSRKYLSLHEQVRIAERAVLKRAGGDHLPDIAFIEGTFVKGRQSDYGQVAVHFAVTHLLWSLRVPWVNVHTSKVKMWATGSGSQRGASKVTKDMVIRSVIETYGHLMNIPAGDDDAADAVALMTMGRAWMGLPLVHLDWLGAKKTRALDGLPSTLDVVRNACGLGGI